MINNKKVKNMKDMIEVRNIKSIRNMKEQDDNNIIVFLFSYFPIKIYFEKYIYKLYYKSSLMIPSNKVDKKHLFDLDSDVSDDDP